VLPVWLLLTHLAHSQTDTVHFSRVFNGIKPYRIYLPAGYSSTEKHYPVIYYFHGNKGNEKLTIDHVQDLVDSASVILVAWNGRSVEEDDRPYNAGYHSNVKYQIQFKDYFPELVAHIDSCYHTIADRAHRAIIGHSMGGFMSFFIAGKYPHLVGTAVSSKGSPEFFVGYPENNTLYPMRYMFKNLHAVKLRFQNGEKGEELVNLNTEVNHGAMREKGLDYEYASYSGPHHINYNQFSDAFRFVVHSFSIPHPAPVRWHHADLYSDFNVWDYKVHSNLQEPGYIELHGVTRGGLEILTRKWQPEGIPIPGVSVNLLTAPIYRPNAPYNIVDYNVNTKQFVRKRVTSDAMGRIPVHTNYQQHQIGIFEDNAPAELVYVAYKANNKGIFLPQGRPTQLQLQLFNRGGSPSGPVTVTLSSSTKGVVIENPVISFSNLNSGSLNWTSTFRIIANNKPPQDGSPFRIRFNLVMRDRQGHIWEDEFDALPLYNVPAFTHIGIDDGDSEIFGSGNGNNIAEPGETIMIYEISHRTRLYYDDPYIDSEKLHDDLQPDKWGDGYALSSLIHISKNCPVGHTIHFLASYEVKEWKTIKRNLTWGVFSITVGKAD
jgi:enterochelin esterase-like enzyme